MTQPVSGSVTPMRRFIPGWQPDHDQPVQLVQHVCGLLKTMLCEDGRAEDAAARASCIPIRRSRS
jgi:hypothetical protein